MRSAILVVVLSASCAPVYKVTTLRPTYVGPERMEINCATFANGDEKELNAKLAKVYAGGWRIASTGTVDGDFFFCFERLAGVKSAAHAPRPAPRVETRPKEETEQPAEEATPKPRSDEETPAPAAPSSESSAPASSSSDSSSDTPPEKPKHRHPIDADPGTAQ